MRHVGKLSANNTRIFVCNRLFQIVIKYRTFKDTKTVNLAEILKFLRKFFIISVVKIKVKCYIKMYILKIIIEYKHHLYRYVRS